MSAAMVGGPIAMIMIIIAGLRARSVLTKGQSPATALVGPLPARNGFARYRRPYRGPLLVGALVTISMVLVDLAAPWPLVIVLDNVIGGAPLPEFLNGLSRFSPGGLAAASAIAGFALVGIGALLGYLVAYINGASRARIGADVRTAVFADLQYAPLRFHEENRTGDLVSRLDEDVDQIEDFLVAPYETALPELLTVGGILAVLVVVDRWLALVALAAIPLLLLWARTAHPAVRRAERIARDRSGEVASRATEGLRNVRAVQAFSQEERNSARFRSSSDAAAVSEIDALERSARLAPVASLVLAAGSSAVLYVGAFRVLDGALSIGVLVVVLAYVAQLYQPIEALTVLVLALAKGAASRDRLLEILQPGSSVVESRDAIDFRGSPRSIGMRDVSFSYDGSRPVLDRVTFQIRNGRRVSIVGATGSGKSTVLALLLRLYEPTSGAVLLDGSDIRTLKLEPFRKQIALVPQDAWIVDGSIADNISFGAPTATAKDIERAARLALVDEFAAGFPDGYETVVGEGGAMLSGGQRRRVALARAILRDAPILLLDEPTSGLDAISERYVLDAIDSVGVGRTVIVVTHSLRIARNSDRIMVLHGGRLVESGTHHGLLRRNRRYGAMWSAQNQGPAVEGVEATRPRLVTAQTTGRR